MRPSQIPGRSKTLSVSPPRRILVTGGSRGIGRAAVLECARRGADVALTYHRRADDAEATAAAARLLGVAATTHQFSLAAAGSACSLATAVQSEGPLDAAVLNAGTWRGGKIDALTPADWWQVVEENLRGTYELTRALLPVLELAPSTSITLVSSVVAIVGFPGDTAYAAAKSALIGFGRSLAKELGPHQMRVNIIVPGFVATEMTDEVTARSRELVLRDIALRRTGTVDEIAKGIAFLAFDAAYMTGGVLVIDGGWSI